MSQLDKVVLLPTAPISVAVRLNLIISLSHHPMIPSFLNNVYRWTAATNRRSALSVDRTVRTPRRRRDRRGMTIVLAMA
ncbi:MAG TPA: hypothetical protein VND64_25360, partial [Pirellulales bacterium]|nr:hypothetical protein [Pirellulales bacterium]